MERGAGGYLAAVVAEEVWHYGRVDGRRPVPGRRTGAVLVDAGRFRAGRRRGSRPIAGRHALLAEKTSHGSFLDG